MTIKNLKVIENLEVFFQGNQLAAFSILGNKTERYEFVRKALVKFSYINLSKKDEGVVIRYLLLAYGNRNCDKSGNGGGGSSASTARNKRENQKQQDRGKPERCCPQTIARYSVIA